ncbi:unnamed protein product [Leuciscus chuanchicus]
MTKCSPQGAPVPKYSPQRASVLTESTQEAVVLESSPQGAPVQELSLPGAPMPDFSLQGASYLHQTPMPACSSHEAPMPKLFTLGISVLVSSIRNLHAQKWHSHHQATQGTMEHECSPQKLLVLASLPQTKPITLEPESFEEPSAYPSTTITPKGKSSVASPKSLSMVLVQFVEVAEPSCLSVLCSLYPGHECTFRENIQPLWSDFGGEM